MSIRIVTPQQAFDTLEKAKRRLIDLAERTKVNGPREAGMYLIKRAREAAPRKDGHTVAGITGTRFGKGFRVTSWVGGKFKQNIWADERMDSEHRYGTRNKVRYGVVARTGKPGFFSWATRMAQDKFSKMSAKDVKSYRVVV